MFKVQGFVNDFLRNTTGVWEGEGRLLNKSRTPNTYSYGYSKAALDASSPFAATKVSKCLIEANTDIVAGDWIMDRADDTEWFVMTTRKKAMSSEAAYWDATLYRVSNYFKVQRFQPSAKNAAGRDIDPAFTDIALNVPVMVNPQSFNTTEQQDLMVESNKIRIVLRSDLCGLGVLPGASIKLGDRLMRPSGSCLIVENIDEDSLGQNGLQILWTDKDTR